MDNATRFISRSENDRLVLSVTKYVPFRGIGHAGGEYALTHYRALQHAFRVASVAPFSALNSRARDAETVSPFHLVQSQSPFAGPAFKTPSDVASVLRGSSAHAWFRRAAPRDPFVKDLARTARIIEFQWSEMASLAGPFRRLAPRAPQVLVAHDIITQRWRRAARHAKDPLARFAFASAARLSARREAESFESVDLVVTFSDKDADLARRLSPRARIEVVHPGFVVPSATHAPSSKEPVVLFTGAMSRPDNDRAVRWFLSKVWPAVRTSVPSCRLVIAGSGPSDRLVSQAAGEERVTVTGFVDTLEPYFSSASVCVIPLLTGAGVKFKTIDAMMRGIPIVSTEVGAEGIADAHAVLTVTDDPTAFGEAVVSILKGAGAAKSQMAKVQAIRTYGVDVFEDRLLALYEGLLRQAARA